MIRWEEAFVEKLISNEIITAKEADLYKFGIECLALKLIHCISYLCIAACFKMVPELIVIGCILIPLRRNAGGYHAKTKMGCYIFSCFYIAIILFVSKAEIDQVLWWGAFALSDAVIFFKSPVDNENKRLDGEEVIHYRRKARYILILANTGCLALTAVHFHYIGNLFRCAVCAAALLLVIHDITEKVLQIKPVSSGSGKQK